MKVHPQCSCSTQRGGVHRQLPVPPAATSPASQRLARKTKPRCLAQLALKLVTVLSETQLPMVMIEDLEIETFPRVAGSTADLAGNLTDGQKADSCACELKANMHRLDGSTKAKTLHTENAGNPAIIHQIGRSIPFGKLGGLSRNLKVPPTLARQTTARKARSVRRRRYLLSSAPRKVPAMLHIMVRKAEGAVRKEALWCKCSAEISVRMCAWRGYPGAQDPKNEGL